MKRKLTIEIKLIIDHVSLRIRITKGIIKWYVIIVVNQIMLLQNVDHDQRIEVVVSNVENPIIILKIAITMTKVIKVIVSNVENPIIMQKIVI